MLLPRRPSPQRGPVEWDPLWHSQGTGSSWELPWKSIGNNKKVKDSYVKTTSACTTFVYKLLQYYYIVLAIDKDIIRTVLIRFFRALSPREYCDENSSSWDRNWADCVWGEKKNPCNDANFNWIFFKLLTCCGSTRKLNTSDPSLEKACMARKLQVGAH